jgi:hypothetical protein
MSKGEERRLLNRLEYQAVVAAKRAAANPVIGDRSDVTGKHEASEPDGSKVFGSKIDNSQPDGNAVRSLKGEAGQLYLQGRTAPPKPKFGDLEDEAIAPKDSTPIEISISPFSKGSDSLSAVDIDNGNGGKSNETTPPTHLGNTLGYIRGQIFDSPVEGSKATYAYAAMGGYEVIISFDNIFDYITSALKFWIKFEFIPAFVFCDLADDPLRNDPDPATDTERSQTDFFLHDLFLISPVEAIAIIRIRSSVNSSFDAATYGYLAYYISGETSTRIATQIPIDSYYFPAPQLTPDYERFAQFIPTTFNRFYEDSINGFFGLYDPKIHASPVYANFFPSGEVLDIFGLAAIEGFGFPVGLQEFVSGYGYDFEDLKFNAVSPTRLYFSLIRNEDRIQNYSDRFLQTNRYIYQVDYATESVSQFKKFKAIAYDPSEFGQASFDEKDFIPQLQQTQKKLYLFSPKFLIY